MRQVCYGIVGKTKMYMSESCVCEDADVLEDELEVAREDEPNEDYKIAPLFTLRRDGTFKEARGVLAAVSQRQYGGEGSRKDKAMSLQSTPTQGMTFRQREWSMKTFLICPVRGHSAEETAEIVGRLEAEGWTVHWPTRNTNQEDPTGLRICTDNLTAIRMANVVHFVWDGKSQGCLFDLGMAFALGKQVIPIRMPEPTEGKSFQNMVSAWAGRAG